MKDAATDVTVDLRPPEVVMRLDRLGQSFPTRLSFLRVLIRTLSEARATVTRGLWRIDADGFGEAVYTLTLGAHSYSLVAISRHLEAADRSDRVIATAWDAAFVLYDGVPDKAELERISQAAPLQEAGRFTERDLVLSRANKSMRLWTHVTDALRAGRQPDVSQVDRIGYLMRTTAVYGNGKFGIADRHLIADRPGLSGPFAVEMLTVWLIREFTLDLVEHVGGGALDRSVKRRLGIGNATGLGMAPFLVSHPVLLHNWITARETALARVRGETGIDDTRRSRLEALTDRALRHLAAWQVPDVAAQAEIEAIAAGLRDWSKTLGTAKGPDCLYAASLSAPLGTQELVVALLLEAWPECVDDLADAMADGAGAPLAGPSDTDDLRRCIARDWAWALRDYDATEECHRFWYVSAAKLEPRIGARFEEPGADLERPLDIGRRVAALLADLPPQSEPIAAFLARHPRHMYAVGRVTTRALHTFSELHGNLIGVECRPIDMLRAKLAFFGATRFDPKSDLWTRVTLAQGAPLRDELSDRQADDWWLAEAGT